MFVNVFLLSFISLCHIVSYNEPILLFILDEAEDPASTPVFWISKWVDYSDKYGLGYQLNNGSVGVLFNDTTRMLMNEDGE